MLKRAVTVKAVAWGLSRHSTHGVYAVDHSVNEGDSPNPHALGGQTGHSKKKSHGATHCPTTARLRAQAPRDAHTQRQTALLANRP